MRDAYFAGGCFWCITPCFDALEGVCGVTSGFSGGDEVDPEYEAVKAQRTHHRETIRVRYDEQRIAYARLLEVFLANVDPFDGGGQFIDRGASYTLAIYWQDAAERDAAERRLRALAQASGREIFVALEPFRGFYEAEEYHQNYYLKHPEAFEREMVESGRRKAGEARR